MGLHSAYSKKFKTNHASSFLKNGPVVCVCVCVCMCMCMCACACACVCVRLRMCGFPKDSERKKESGVMWGSLCLYARRLKCAIDIAPWKETKSNTVAKLELIETKEVEITRDITHVNTSCHASGCVQAQPSRTLANSFDHMFWIQILCALYTFR